MPFLNRSMNPTTTQVMANGTVGPLGMWPIRSMEATAPGPHETSNQAHQLGTTALRSKATPYMAAPIARVKLPCDPGDQVAWQRGAWATRQVPDATVVSLDLS